MLHLLHLGRMHRLLMILINSLGLIGLGVGLIGLVLNKNKAFAFVSFGYASCFVYCFLLIAMSIYFKKKLKKKGKRLRGMFNACTKKIKHQNVY